MAQSPDWQQFLEAGMHFTAMTRAEAQRRARELVREGQLAQERVQGFVEELLETSRKRADEFVDAVRYEVERQLKALGVTARLPRRRPATTAKPPKKTAKKTAKKTTKSTKKAGKSAGATKKSGAKKSGAKKSAAKKSGAKKSGAKKAAKATKQAAKSATKQSP